MGKKGFRRYYLVLGLDFGTSFTGISYALSKSEDIYAIDEWPRNDTKVTEAEQVPSIIAYSGSSNDNFPWGYRVTPGMENSCAFMKLHLDRNLPPAPYVYDSENMRKQIDSGHFRLPIQRIARVVTLDYLTGVFKHARAFLAIKLGRDFLDITSIHFWITNPESLGNEAPCVTVQLAKEAAREAGFDRNGFEENLFRAVGESEAAVTATLLENSDRPLDLGRNILVCNCGAGQLDITVYKLAAVVPQLKLLKQTTFTQGPECGAVEIDLRLHRFMERKFKHHFTSLPASDKGPGSRFMNEFEFNKRKFDKPTTDDHQNRILLKLAMKDARSSNLYLSSGFVVLTGMRMQRLLDPVVNKIIASISHQVEASEPLPNRRVTDIVLVGGLGNSPYLRSKLRDWWSNGHQSINLRIPKDSWGAIATGAVATGLERAIIN